MLDSTTADYEAAGRQQMQKSAVFFKQTFSTYNPPTFYTISWLKFNHRVILHIFEAKKSLFVRGITTGHPVECLVVLQLKRLIQFTFSFNSVQFNDQLND